MVVGLAELLASHDDLLAVVGGEGGGDAPGFAVLQQVRGMEVPDHQDAVGQWISLSGLAASGSPSRRRPGRFAFRNPFRYPIGPTFRRCHQGSCREVADEPGRLSSRAALAAHDQIDVAASDAGAVVVPDVLGGVDVE